MKKKYFSLILIFALFLPCLFLLTACGGKESPQVIAFEVVETESNTNYGASWHKGSVAYGSNPILDDFKLILRYSDQSSKEVQESDSKFSVKYYYTDLTDTQTEVDSLTNLQIGEYSIVFTYKDKNIFEVVVSFSVVKADYQNTYTIQLGQTNIQYGDPIPEITVVPSTGKVVEYGIKYLNQTQYEEYLSLDNDRKQEFLAKNDNQVYDSFFGDYTIGEYYIYAEISSENYNNKYSEPTNLTVKPANIYKVDSGEENVTATLNYGYMSDEITIGNVRLGDIRIDDFYGNVRYEDQYGQYVAGTLKWSSEQENLEVNYNNNGHTYNVMFVPESDNYVPIFYGNVELNVVKGEVYYEDVYQNIQYNPDLQNKTFTIYNNRNIVFRPLDYIDVYKFDGSIWQKVTLDEDGNYSLLDTVSMQAGEYKYKLCLKDKTNFDWKIDGEVLSSDDIEVVKEISQLRLSPDFVVDSANLTVDGYVLIPFKNNENRLTNFTVEAVNKENNQGLYGGYYKGSAEFVEIEGQDYIKYTPTGLYSSEGVLNNQSDLTSARAYFKISATPIDENYYFESYESDVFVTRLRPGPTLEETATQPIELTPGKTYRECFTFMLPENLGSYTSSDIDLEGTVPEVLTQKQISLSFVSNSPIYYSLSALTINIELADTQVSDAA